VNWLIYETAKWRNVGQDIRRSEHQGIREPVYQGTLETRKSGDKGKRDNRQEINYKYQITNAK